MTASDDVANGAAARALAATWPTPQPQRCLATSARHKRPNCHRPLRARKGGRVIARLVEEWRVLYGCDRPQPWMASRCARKAAELRRALKGDRCEVVENLRTTAASPTVRPRPLPALGAAPWRAVAPPSPSYHLGCLSSSCFIAPCFLATRLRPSTASDRQNYCPYKVRLRAFSSAATGQPMCMMPMVMQLWHFITLSAERAPHNSRRRGGRRARGPRRPRAVFVAENRTRAPRTCTGSRLASSSARGHSRTC